MNIKTAIRVIIGVVVIALALFWAIDSIRARTFTGEEVSFNMGSGSIVVTNPTEELVVAQLTSPRRFTMASTDLDLSLPSTREGRGSNVRNLAAVELPAGKTDLRVTRGSNVLISMTAEEPLTAVLTPMAQNAARNTAILAGLVVLGALYFISRTFDHRWMGWLRQRGQKRVDPNTAGQAA